MILKKFSVLAVSFLAFLFGIATTVSAQVGGSTTVVLQDGLNGYAGTTDTYINTYAPTTNLGSDTTISVKNYETREILLRFDLSSIPTGATISSAALGLYIASNTGNGGGDTISLNHILDKSWVESQATWNVYATGSNWSTPGLGSGTDYTATADATSVVGYNPANVWSTFSITSLAQGWINGTIANNGVIVHTSNGPQIIVDSSEFSTDATLRPKLTITYTGGTASTPAPDTTAPSVPTSLTATAISTSQINLSWGASTDNVGVTGYNVYRNGTPIASVAATSYNDIGLAASTAYSYTVAAYDAAGNISVQSTSASATTQTVSASDTTAPSTPTNLTATVVSSSQINLSWSASTDNVGVTGYRVYRGSTLLTTTTGISYSNTGLTASTAYSYTVSAYDAAGNTSAQSTSVSATTQAALSPSDSFSFTATGDIGATADTTVTLQNMASQNGAFTLAIGDLSYDQLTPESAWCSYVKGIFGATYPFMVEVGNHENNGPNGDIANFASCLPPQTPITGTYGREYYFDYPTSNPLARFFMLPAGEGKNYTNGSSEQAWLNTTIDQARSSGIKWIIVGMHMLCPTMGEKSCQTYDASPGPDLFNFLVSKKVDLVLHGHDHSYQRSKQFALSSSCASIPVQSDATPNAAANLSCIVDSGDALTKGAGTVIVISGITPNYQWPYSLFPNDPEAPYFKKTQNDNYGYTKITLSGTQLTEQFIATGHTNGTSPTFTDTFTISDGSSSAPVDTTAPSTPTNLTATVVSSSQINLSWSASTDNVGVTGYRVYRGSTLLTTTTGISYSNTGLTASTAYSYTVSAYDAAGNTSAQSTSVSATTQASTAPPPASTKFSLNDRVQVQSGPLNVRATASATGALLGQQAVGALGTVVGGPTAADGYNWWNINYDTGADGWSAEDYLVKYTASTPPSSACADPVGGLFPANNYWNRDISQFPISSNSATYVSWIGGTTGLHADFGSTADNGIPYIAVGGNQPYIPINLLAYADESDPGPYPMPLNAPIEGGGSGSGDAHVLVYNTSNRYIYEIYHAQAQSSSWNADSSAIFDAVTNLRRPVGWTSTDAAGLPVLAGLTRYDEVQCGGIRHALRFTANLVRNTYIYPASHTDGQSSSLSAPPMGTRFRLKANFDISSFSPAAKVMLQAMKTYGIILADTGSNWYISGEPNAKWNDSDINSISQVAGSNFEAVDTSSIQPSTDTNSPTGPGNLTLTAAGGNQLNAAWLAAADNVGVVGYRITVSTNADLSNPLTTYHGAYVGNTLASSITGLNASTKYYVQVLAYDEAGNVSAGATGNAITGSGTTSIPVPTLALSASPASVTSGSSSTLTWSSVNATSCTASGSWSGTKATSGTQSITNLTTTGTYTLSCTGTGGTTNASTTITVTAPPICTSFTYSGWNSCQSNNTQSRTTTSSSPQGCTGGTPVLTQSCVYTPPSPPTQTTCTTFTYSAWGTCQPDSTQSRTADSAFPQGCTGGTPTLSQVCTYTPPVITPPPSGGGGGGGGTTTGGGTTSSSGGTSSGTGTSGGGGTTTTTGGTGTTSTTGGGTTTQPTFPTLTGPFSIGQRGEQVKFLQQMLKQDGVFAEEATGYYGSLTQKAVETFQTKYNLITSGTPGTTGYGLAGPSTRAKLNQFYAGGGSTTDREALLASLRKQVAELMVILQSLIAKLAALKAVQGVR